MKIVPTSSCGSRGDQEDTSRAVSGRTASVLTMGEECCCLGVHSINFIWKLPIRSEIAPKLQTLALLLNFHLNIHTSFSCGASASASLVGFDSTSNAYLLHRWLVESAFVASIASCLKHDTGIFIAGFYWIPR
jgi:hypothetical protein